MSTGINILVYYGIRAAIIAADSITTIVTDNQLPHVVCLTCHVLISSFSWLIYTVILKCEVPNHGENVRLRFFVRRTR